MSLIEYRSQGIRLESSIATYQQDQKIWFDAAAQSFSDIISKLEEPPPAPNQTCPDASQLGQLGRNHGPVTTFHLK